MPFLERQAGFMEEQADKPPHTKLETPSQSSIINP